MRQRLLGYLGSVLFCTAAFCAPNPPELMVQRTSSPVEISSVRVDSIGDGGEGVELFLTPVSKQRLLDTAINVSYWQNDLPLGGHVVWVTEKQIYGATSIPVKLSGFSKVADKILFSVVSARSASAGWKMKSTVSISLLERAAWNLETKFDEMDWQARPAELSTTSSDCSGMFGDCNAAVRATCGEGNIGGVSFIGSTCTACYYCKGSAPQKCGEGSRKAVKVALH
jgi:hypothetical protein